MTALSIGKLSKSTDVKVPTIRFYEQIGLLPEPDRTDSDRRVYGDRGYQGCRDIIKAAAPQARDFTNRRVRKPDGQDEAERLRNRTKSRTRARVEHPFHVLKRLWGFVKVRYRGLAKNANRVYTALAMVNLYMAARRVPALVRP